jgi:hypothetical protein
MHSVRTCAGWRGRFPGPCSSGGRGCRWQGRSGSPGTACCWSSVFLLLCPAGVVRVCAWSWEEMNRIPLLAPLSKKEVLLVGRRQAHIFFVNLVFFSLKVWTICLFFGLFLSRVLLNFVKPILFVRSLQRIQQEKEMTQNRPTIFFTKLLRYGNSWLRSTQVSSQFLLLLF